MKYNSVDQYLKYPMSILFVGIYSVCVESPTFQGS